MIRLGQPEHIDEIIAVTKACGRHLFENGIDQWDENYPDRSSIEKDIEAQSLFIYQEENIILGLVVLNESQDEEYDQINWLTAENAKNLIVHRLAVHPSSQGKGIARKIMDHSEEYAQEKGYDSIRLDTFSQNPRNQKFYQNRGYKELGSVFLKYKKDHPYFCYELLF